MRKFRQYAATTLIVAMVGTNMSIPALADVSEDTGGGEKEDGTWTVTTGISVKGTGS